MHSLCVTYIISVYAEGYKKWTSSFWMLNICLPRQTKFLNENVETENP